MDKKFYLVHGDDISQKKKKNTLSKFKRQLCTQTKFKSRESIDVCFCG